MASFTQKTSDSVTIIPSKNHNRKKHAILNRHRNRASATIILTLILTCTLTNPGYAQTVQTPYDEETQARHDFEAIWEPANVAIPFSTDSVISTCNAGTANPKAVAEMLKTWNYARSLNGLRPVKIPPNYAPTKKAQAAALTAAAGPQASADPTQIPDSVCVTEDVKLASRSGVLARLDGIVSPGTEILRYLTEASTTNSNDNLGHRLELLSPFQTHTAIGAVSIGTSGPSSSSIQLFNSTYKSAGIPLTPPMWDNTIPAPTQITWPSAGFFPTRLLPTGAGENISRWSYSAHCADLTQATVSLNGPKGNVPLQVIHRNEPAIDPNLTPWNYAGYDTLLFKIPVSELNIPNFYNISNYTVSISGINPAPNCKPIPPTTSYQVKLFNSSWPANPHADTDGDGIANSSDDHPRIPDLNTSRISGIDRIETAINIALEFSPEKVKTIYLARSDILADALVGGTLKDGPVLLLPAENHPLPSLITKTIEYLNPQEIVALGGTGAVSDTRLYQLSAGRKATRLGGANREETSITIARRAYTQADSLYLAQAYGRDGNSSPDALTAASLQDGPIILLNQSSPTLATARQLATDLHTKRVVALGGSAVLPDSILNTVAAHRAATRLAGENRYQTSQQIALEAFRLHPDTTKAYLARGDEYADAVTGGKLSDGPMILLPAGCQKLDTYTLKTLGKINAFRITALGGSSAVCEANLIQSLNWPEMVNDTVTDF